MILEELDLSGTAVKTLDLREAKARNLKHLILLGCEKLCAILWPPELRKTNVLKVLHIDTTRSTSPGQANWEESPRDPIAAVGSLSIHVATATELGISQHASFDFKWYISPRDTRILRSLEPVKNIKHSHVYMEMGSSPTSGATVGDSEVAQGIRSLCKPDNYSYASDAFFQSNLQAGAGNEGAISWMWDCPAIPTPTAQDLYVHLQDNQGMKRGLLQQQQSNIEGINISADSSSRRVFNNACMLHVHDTSSITCITCPQGSYWRSLEWCRVERCPELRTVFRTAQQSNQLFHGSISTRASILSSCGVSCTADVFALVYGFVLLSLFHVALIGLVCALRLHCEVQHLCNSVDLHCHGVAVHPRVWFDLNWFVWSASLS